MITRVHSYRFPLLIMSISNMQWCAEIGIFNTTSEVRYFTKKSFRVAATVFCFSLILVACGDIELNPCPKNRNSCYNF